MLEALSYHLHACVKIFPILPCMPEDLSRRSLARMPEGAQSALRGRKGRRRETAEEVPRHRAAWHLGQRLRGPVGARGSDGHKRSAGVNPSAQVRA